MKLTDFERYKRPLWMPSRHIETVVPALWRKISGLQYERERWELDDGDFIDLDWKRGDNYKRLVIICHGMEGSTDRAYMMGMAKALAPTMDVLTWNFRGCSGELNRLPRFYHSGETSDLQGVIDYARNSKNYSSISLVGFSLGGNLILKYLGEQGRKAVGKIEKAIAISVPLHLKSCCEVISKPQHKMYSHRFLVTLKDKVRSKAVLMPDSVESANLKYINDLTSFDDYVTAPLHGFINANDYYAQCSSLFFLGDIAIPTLVINAKNDPFLSELAFPTEAELKNSMVNLMYPRKGGHVGFSASKLNEINWTERLAQYYFNLHG